MAMGRPREFDVDKALDLALQVFWRKGYEGASMADLTETMGITKPSLYSAFGNKEELFRKALDRYVDGPGGYFQVALAKPTMRAVVEHLLYESADAVTDPNHPPGCLAVQGALSCGDAAESIKQELMSRRAKGEQDLRQRFERAGQRRIGVVTELDAQVSVGKDAVVSDQIAGWPLNLNSIESVVGDRVFFVKCWNGNDKLHSAFPLAPHRMEKSSRAEPYSQESHAFASRPYRRRRTIRLPQMFCKSSRLRWRGR